MLEQDDIHNGLIVFVYFIFTRNFKYEFKYEVYTYLSMTFTPLV